MKRMRFLFGPPGEQGAIAPIVALGLVAFVGFLALGIDLGQLYVVKNDLQNAADAAALAGAKALIQDANNDGVAEFNPDLARTAAKDCANKNRSLGAPDALTVADADVVIGRWDLATKTLDTNAAPNQVNAVQVTVRRTGADNPQVQTFLGNALGVGDKKNVEAMATAFLDLAGTSSIDPPITIPTTWTSGDGPLVSNGLQRLLDAIAPAPAHAALPQSYQFKDLGGTSLDTTRATFVVPQQSELSLTYLQKYIKGKEAGGLRFPQKKVGDRLYPISEWKWPSNIKSNYSLLKTRWNNYKDGSGKWRVTVPAYKTTPVTALLPRNSWLLMASRLLPGVSQAHACAAYTSPAIYNQGFVTVDITNVVSDCNTSITDVNNSNHCRYKCYAVIQPVNENTISTDKASTPAPYTKDYQDMNPAASEVGVFSAIPKIVK